MKTETKMTVIESQLYSVVETLTKQIYAFWLISLNGEPYQQNIS